MSRENSKSPVLGLGPFRRAVLRGLGVILPPLLTIVFLLWIANSVQRYLVTPMEWAAKRVLVSQVAEIYETGDERLVDDVNRGKLVDGKQFVKVNSGQWVPKKVYQTVQSDPGDIFPNTAQALYERYVEIRWLRRSLTVPVFLAVLILGVYLLGKVMAARIGNLIWTQFEQLINHLPLIRSVYGTVKQVTDIVVGDRDNVEYTRVVAVEYPRKGIWSVGFVTGESMMALQEVAQEPLLSVLMPTSPMPATGFTITVRRSETVELELSVDQAFQFVVSCGVVVPKTGASPQDVKKGIESAVNTDTPSAGDLEASSS